MSVPVVWLVAVPLFVFYILLPAPGPTRGQHIDPLTNAVTAWQVGMRGTVVLDGYERATAPEYYRNIGWYVDSSRGPVSQYPPGAALLAAPFYRTWGEGLTAMDMVGTNNPDAPPIRLPMPSVTPARLAAATASAVAMGFLSMAVLAVGMGRTAAIATGLVAGVATPMWSVAASALWQHGPGAMWVALGVWLAAKSRYLLSGLAFGAAILTRPHLAIIGAVVGVYVAWKSRDIRPMAKVAATSSLGLIGLLVFNWWLWGRLTVTGGYSSAFADHFASGDVVGFARNLLGALVDPRVGLLLVTPFLLPLIFRLRPAWKDAPAWTKGAALGGLLYLLVQYKANRYSGGEGFVGYRYPLEALTAAGPLLALAYPHWVRERPAALVIFWLCVAASLFMLVFVWR